MLRIGVRRTARVNYAIADCDVANASANSLDNARSLTAETGRRIDRIEPRSVIDVNEVQADGRVPYAGFSLGRIWKVDFFPSQNIRSAEFVNAYRVGLHLLNRLPLLVSGDHCQYIVLRDDLFVLICDFGVPAHLSVTRVSAQCPLLAGEANAHRVAIVQRG